MPERKKNIRSDAGNDKQRYPGVAKTFCTATDEKPGEDTKSHTYRTPTLLRIIATMSKYGHETMEEAKAESKSWRIAMLVLIHAVVAGVFVFVMLCLSNIRW